MSEHVNMSSFCIEAQVAMGFDPMDDICDHVETQSVERVRKALQSAWIAGRESLASKGAATPIYRTIGAKDQ